MPPKLKSWTLDNEFNLINKVKNRPLLWDVTLAEYRRNDLKEVHWKEIASVLGPGFTGPIVIKRYLHMRDIFMDNYRKVKEFKRSGNGTDSVYIPKCTFYHSLSFLLKVAHQSVSISTMQPICFTAATTSILEARSDISSNVIAYFDENMQRFVATPKDQSSSPFPLNISTAESSSAAEPLAL